MPTNLIKNRYSCQIPLDGFGNKSQKKLASAKVLIVGVGGLGCPASLYLAAAGVGVIGLADGDTIALSNLHRQILFSHRDINKSKTTIAKKLLSAQNPDISINKHNAITHENVFDIIANYDIVVDACDNFETRYLINDACVISGKPLIHGSIYQYEGQIAVWNVKNNDGRYSANYRDVYPQVDSWLIPDCADGGVIPTIGGIIGSMQASEVIKYITGIGDLLKSRLLIFNVKSMSTYEVALPKNTKVGIKKLQPKLDIIIISSEDFRRLNSDQKSLVIDVRTEHEHETQNLGGKNIPLKKIIENDWDFSSTKSIIFYCRSGKRSLEAAKYVKYNSPNIEVMSLAGGIESYK